MGQQSSHPLISYRVDTSGIIKSVNDAWLSFACANDWRITEKDIIGESLWRYIANDEVKHLYHLAMEKTHRSGKSVSFIYHCDSADLIRKLQMDICFDQSQQQFNFNNTIISIVRREPVDLLRNDVSRNDECLTICSWCKNINTAQDKWLDVEQAINYLNIFSEKKSYPQLSHGVCPQCRTIMLEV